MPCTNTRDANVGLTTLVHRPDVKTIGGFLPNEVYKITFVRLMSAFLRSDYSKYPNKWIITSIARRRLCIVIMPACCVGIIMPS